MDSLIRKICSFDTSAPEIPDALVSRIVSLAPATGVLREHVAKTIGDALSVYPDLAYVAGALVLLQLEETVRSSVPNGTLGSLRRINELGLLAPGLMDAVESIEPQFTEIVDRARARFHSPGFLLRFFDYFGAKTIVRQYLTVDHSDTSDVPIEDVVSLYARVSATIHLTGDKISPIDIDRFEKTLNAFLSKKISHASPTMFAGHQNASCFLLDMEDSIRGIYGTVLDCALISQKAGGIGVSASKIRARGSVIRGANGRSSGIIPMLQMLNGSIKYVDQGGRRPGAAAVYIEPWHAEIMEFLELRKNAGPESLRARDLFYALWVPDLFMERLRDNGVWSLMCPDESPGLTEVYGAEFKELYERYEAENRYRVQVPAAKIWSAVCSTALETGLPYVLFKDAANRTSNQQNVSIIRSSNLCAEILEVSGRLPDGENHTAVCNLASIALPAFVSEDAVRLDAETKGIDPKKSLDYAELKETARMLTRNLDRLITVNDYPIESTKTSNEALRPIGIGIQGLADVFHALYIAPDSPEAAAVNSMVMETIYLGFLEETHALACEYGAYRYFENSPASKGMLNFDFYGVSPQLWDFGDIRAAIQRDGMRNSLGLALMPTASTAQILGNTESFEFPAYFFGTRRVKSGEYQVINRRLVSVLKARGLWSQETRDAIILNGGRISGIDGIPQDIQDVFVTAYDIKQKTSIDLAAGRQPFICQSQSMNLYMSAGLGTEASYRRLTKMVMYAWKRGLKTGMYYLRSEPARLPRKITISARAGAVEARDSGDIETSSGSSSGTSSPVSLSEESMALKNIVCTDEICIVCSA